MAQNIIYSDIAENFEMNPFTHDVAASINDQAVKDSLLNLLLTNKGERLYQPLVGSDIPSLLFENVSFLTAYQIKTNIELTVSNFEPRVRLVDIKIDDMQEKNEYFVQVDFIILNDISKQQSLEFTLTAQQA